MSDTLIESPDGMERNEKLPIELSPQGDCGSTCDDFHWSRGHGCRA